VEENQPRSRQQIALRLHWRRTCTTLEKTYFPDPAWAITDHAGHNAAGYMLWALQRFRESVNLHYAHREYTDDELDLAASREIGYLHYHGRVFRCTPPALAKCLTNMALERPEKLDQARRFLADHAGQQDTTCTQNLCAQSTATQSSSVTGMKRTSGPTPIGSVLQELTRQSFTPTPSQAQKQHGNT
jgi:hypothetical protein